MINRRIQVNRKIFFNSRPKLKFTALKTRKKNLRRLLNRRVIMYMCILLLLISDTMLFQMILIINIS